MVQGKNHLLMGPRGSSTRCSWIGRLVPLNEWNDDKVSVRKASAFESKNTNPIVHCDQHLTCGMVQRSSTFEVVASSNRDRRGTTLLKFMSTHVYGQLMPKVLDCIKMSLLIKFPNALKLLSVMLRCS